jgi:hypothetical protein
LSVPKKEKKIEDHQTVNQAHNIADQSKGIPDVPWLWCASDPRLAGSQLDSCPRGKPLLAVVAQGSDVAYCNGLSN